ncbi:MAG: hypothetical protein II570_02205, partial [Bacteroidaceae bacterium]|nr:hypothetical protein [Bacteroidaceae bacterium]
VCTEDLEKNMYFCGKFYSLFKARRVNVEGSPFGLRRAKGSVKSKENVSKIRGKVLKKRRGTSVKPKPCRLLSKELRKNKPQITRILQMYICVYLGNLWFLIS